MGGLALVENIQPSGWQKHSRCGLVVAEFPKPKVWKSQSWSSQRVHSGRLILNVSRVNPSEWKLHLGLGVSPQLLRTYHVAPLP